MDRIVSDVKDLTNSDVIVWCDNSMYYSDFKLLNDLNIKTSEHMISIDVGPVSEYENTHVLSFNMSSSLLCIKDKKSIAKRIIDFAVMLNTKAFNLVDIMVKVVTNETIFTLYVNDVIENNNTELLLEVLEFVEGMLSNSVDYSECKWINVEMVSECDEDYQEAIREFLNTYTIMEGNEK